MIFSVNLVGIIQVLEVIGHHCSQSNLRVYLFLAQVNLIHELMPLIVHKRTLTFELHQNKQINLFLVIYCSISI